MDKYSNYPGLAELNVAPHWKDYIIMMLDKSPGARDRIKMIDCVKYYHPGLTCS